MSCTNVIILPNACLILKAPSLTTQLIKDASSRIIHYCSHSLQLNYRSNLAEKKKRLRQAGCWCTADCQTQYTRPECLQLILSVPVGLDGAMTIMHYAYAVLIGWVLCYFWPPFLCGKTGSWTGSDPWGTSVHSSTSSDTAKCIFSGEFHNKMTVIYHYKPLYHLVNKRPLSLTFFFSRGVLRVRNLY